MGAAVNCFSPGWFRQHGVCRSSCSDTWRPARAGTTCEARLGSVTGTPRGQTLVKSLDRGGVTLRLKLVLRGRLGSDTSLGLPPAGSRLAVIPANLGRAHDRECDCAHDGWSPGLRKLHPYASRYRKSVAHVALAGVGRSFTRTLARRETWIAARKPRMADSQLSCWGQSCSFLGSRSSLRSQPSVLLWPVLADTQIQGVFTAESWPGFALPVRLVSSVL